MTEAVGQESRRISLPLPLHRPIVMWVLLGAIAIVFGIETLAGGSESTEVLIRMGAKVTPLIAAGQYWRLFTAMFLHIGIMHLFFNGYALFAIGTELERLQGWERFLTIYLLSGLSGNVASYALSPNLAAGASGAIFGLIGALAAFFARHREQLGTWGQKRLLNVVFLIAVNLVFGFTQPGIDNWAHLGGLICGFALGWIMAPIYRVDPVALRLDDTNALKRYWPAIAIALTILIGVTTLATAKQRDSIQSHLWRAEQAAARESWDEVIAELEQALAEDPEAANSSLYFYLGLAHSYKNEHPLAAQAYEAAIDLEPDDAASRWNLALTYLQLDQYKDAKMQFESYLQRNPGSEDEVRPYLEELQKLAP